MPLKRDLCHARKTRIDLRLLSRELTMIELCRRFGTTRSTVDKWIVCFSEQRPDERLMYFGRARATKLEGM